MLAAVRVAEALTLLATGFAFLASTVALGMGLARAGFAMCDARGRLRLRNVALVASSFAVLVFAFSLTTWWMGWFHPALVVFYSAGGGVLSLTARVRSPGAGER